jgi:thiamine biosynthesis lipoprotein
MTRPTRTILRAALLPFVVAAVACTSSGSGLSRFEYSRESMGTELRVVLYASDRAKADAASAAVFTRVDELDRRLSDWRDDSEIATLARRAAAGVPTGPIPVSDDLARVLAVAQEISRRSGGAFDVTVGPLVQLWRRAKRQGELPDEAALAAARAATGWQKLRLDVARGTVELTARGMRLDLGGIAKGYAAEAALAVLRARGIESALVAAGGDVVAGAPPPGESGWTVALAEPGDAAGERPRFAIALAHAAVSTSGDDYRFVEIGGRRFSHIVDPKTGLGLEKRLLVNVVARDGATADALATAISVLGPEAGLLLLESMPGAAARIVAPKDDAWEACTSAGWPPMMPAPARGE